MAEEELGEESRRKLELLGSGRAAEVFSWTPGVVLKLVRETRFEDGLRREALSLATAAAAGIPVPRPLGFVMHDGRLGLLLERIDGLDMFALMAARPWRTLRLAREAGRLHVTLADATAPDSITGLKDYARNVISASTYIPERARPRVLAVVSVASDGDGLCHMDFHPGNVMLSGDGAHIIDFANARRGPAIADHARTWVILRAGLPPVEMNWLSARFTTGLRRVALAGYSRGYRSAAVVDEADLVRWKTVQLALRLVEGIPAERRRLLRLLSRTLREAERLPAPN